MSDLTTLSDVEAWLALKPGNTDEPLLARLISASSALVEQYCDRVFAVNTYIEIRDGNGADTLPLRHRPVVSVSSLAINGSGIGASTGYGQAGYLVTPSALKLIGLRFTRGTGNIAITYQAGYQTIPLDVAQATIELVAMRYRERDRIGLASKGVAGETTAFSLAAMPASVQTLLATYRQPVPL